MSTCNFLSFRSFKENSQKHPLNFKFTKILLTCIWSVYEVGLMAMFLGTPLMVYLLSLISQLIRFARASSHEASDFNSRTAKLLKQVYRYHKLRKAFSRFYHRHFELIEKYVILEKPLQQGISNLEFYEDLVYKFI